MSDIAQQGLKEPEQVDWDNYGTSKYIAPPPALGADGKAITYYGVVLGATEEEPDEGYLNFLLDPIKLVKAGDLDGYQIRFTRASTRPRTKLVNGVAVPVKGNPNRLADYLRGCGMTAKPQRNEEYRAAVKMVVGQNRQFPFVGDWEAYNKDTGESVKGFLSFPEDEARPGQRKSVLKNGEKYYVTNKQGQILEVKTVQSEVLFANFRLRYFVDPSRGR